MEEKQITTDYLLILMGQLYAQNQMSQNIINELQTEINKLKEQLKKNNKG